jgi:RNA polymerase sigma-70 factor (ECF subfamily)
VRRVTQGDASAFAELYEKHAPTVASVVRHELHDRNLAADIVQEVFARALASIGNLREPGSFRAWLLSIAHHMAIDARRSARRSHRVAFDVAPEPEDPYADPFETAQVAELARTVRVCMTRLSPQDALILGLVGDLGFTPAEVAATLGVSRGAAKVRVHRARRRLLERLTVELFDRCRERIACPQLLLALAESERRGEEHVRGCSVCQTAVLGELDLFRARSLALGACVSAALSPPM